MWRFQPPSTESCDVHYAGTICQKDQLPATDQCPFKSTGIFELTPVEPAAVQAQSGASYGGGNYTRTVDEAGNTVTVPTATCHHTPEFMAQENIAEIIAQEQALMNAPAQPAADPNAQPAADPNAQPAADPNAQPAADPNAQPAADPNAQPQESADALNPEG